MKIRSVETFRVKIPLKKPFKTALRTVTEAESIYVTITLEDGTIGFGEAPPNLVVTGDTLNSIQTCIEHIFKPILLGQSIQHINNILEIINQSIVRNTSAKAAVDMALYDCLSRTARLPLYQLLGGYRDSIDTDYTVSVNDPDEMALDAQTYINDGFQMLKVKVGKDDIHQDLKRIQAIREMIGPKPIIRLDANQGWSVKEAIYAINQMEALDLNIELVEQPVKANDIKGLKQVTDRTNIPIMADESVFSPDDARKVLETGSADLINIKLMKTGGIYNALKISQMADAFGIECMVGSMIETKLGITAAAHFAASQKNITRYDFDAPLMLADDPLLGGIQYEGPIMTFSDEPGLGIYEAKEDFIIHEEFVKNE
ncbi:mandelate racemase/muconate lactonizing enzyme family protein [Tenuibacillus multivorans]|uniref:Dipeptide epimerase n=1 Tax=Tenuibacillus multivorans TaxID=237069 RepID=A0A1G9W3J7_9BACI|nr:dipeptide epimerase [Tenuibacillus multivorans]GEL78756.1 L-Ala-D/L-Glu epimerase [Tenuibacillus multivorans]SDM79142.1 o-succinylbenzoate synthase/o-succinylbenzoate synthase,TIGR01928 [Tenuibacillus multivorans]